MFKIEISEINKRQIKEFTLDIINLLNKEFILELEIERIYKANNKKYNKLEEIDYIDMLNESEFISSYISRKRLLESRVSLLETILNNAKKGIF